MGSPFLVIGEPISHAETQWEGIMCEGLNTTLGGGCDSCVAYLASTSGRISAMCWASLGRTRRSSVTAKLVNMATFPGNERRIPAMLAF